MAAAQSANTPLLLPSSVAFDANGNLFFAESSRHVIRRLTPDGVLSIVAGTGTQGFAGDGGPATVALLDSPAAVVVDPAGDLLIADTHNHCIRRVDGATGIMSRYAQASLPVALAFDGLGSLVYADAGTHQIVRIDAGSGATSVLVGIGTQGFAGDGGLATAAMIDSPYGLAFDAAGDLFFADTRNHRVRRVDAVSGFISTVAGTGVAGFAGDAASALAGQLDLPRGLTVDGTGNLYIADSRNQRIRRIDAMTGLITTVAGDGTQAFAGDGSAVTRAALDSPRGVALSPDGQVTLADRANNRVRQADAAANLQTIAGVGAVTVARSATNCGLTQTSAQGLTVMVTAGSGIPAGTVALIDATTPVATATLTAGVATFSVVSLSTGSHTLTASYAGDASFLPSVSQPLIVTIGDAASANFTLASNGPAAVTVVAGNAASFGFTLTPTGSALSSQIVLSAAGLPAGATATFTPSYLPPPSAPVNFTLVVATPAHAMLLRQDRLGGAVFALLGALLFVRRRGRRYACSLCAILLAGCGNRIYTGSEAMQPVVSYTISVSATGTSPTGATLLQSVPVTLTVQE